MDDDVLEAIELISYLCRNISDVPTIYPEDENVSTLRCIKRISSKLVQLKKENNNE